MSKLEDMILQYSRNINGPDVVYDDEFKQQIKDLMLELIGEDEDTWGLLGEQWATENARRDLRQELRKKVEEL